ncbi:MAG: hypothetical protein Q4P18_06520 [Methanobrevibacter sp.]|uniref:hypothetical protein n=1 Tax=Methanobrevibacter sp. TaxID=66852 RepID=UPI0026DF35D4|nr:hypothetical protein [Methanobrevibacter sp.]MDO5849169.1 hypothetical protein [Methanobrevibacter sp.]
MQIVGVVIGATGFGFNLLAEDFDEGFTWKKLEDAMVTTGTEYVIAFSTLPLPTP